MKLKPRFTFLEPTPLVAPTTRALRRLCKFDAMGREAELAAQNHAYRTVEPFPAVTPKTDPDYLTVEREAIAVELVRQAEPMTVDVAEAL